MVENPLRCKSDFAWQKFAKEPHPRNNRQQFTTIIRSLFVRSQVLLGCATTYHHRIFDMTCGPWVQTSKMISSCVTVDKSTKSVSKVN